MSDQRRSTDQTEDRPSRRPLAIILLVLALAAAAAYGIGQMQANDRSNDLDEQIEDL